MTAVAATLLEPCTARGHVQFIMGNQDCLGCDTVKISQGSHRPSAAIHEGVRSQQPQIVATEGHPRRVTMEFALRRERSATAPGNLLNKKSTRVVAGAFVGLAWIAEPDDELDSQHSVISLFGFGLLALGLGCTAVGFII